MTNIARTSPASAYGALRSQTSAILTGPKSLTLDKGFYGWPCLTLQIQAGWEDRVESRIVYANLANQEQEIAILRAVFWDGEANKKAIRQGQPISTPTLAARFVVIQTSKLNEWLSSFADISVKAFDNFETEEDDRADIKKLKIVIDYKSSIFERVWQTSKDIYTNLNEPYAAVWSEMTDLLLQEKPYDGTINEDFWIGNPPVEYDFDAYNPDFNLHK